MPLHRAHAFAALLALAAGTAARAEAPDAGVPTHPLAGTWKLDLKASSDLSPVFEHFGANFVVRGVASSVAPTNTITWKADGFEMKVQAMLTRVTPVRLDGVTPSHDDIFGNTITFTSTLEGQVVVSRGFVVRKDGVKEKLDMRRTVEPDGTMQLKTVITPSEGAPLEIRRVFRRVAAQ